MQIHISSTGTTPIYEQIASQIKTAILLGELKEGEMLPSMRTLAAELRISVITTKRAYEELERDGLIVSQTGKGSFVAAGNVDLLREARLKTVEENLTGVVAYAKESGVTLEELMHITKLLYDEEV
ncbi:GntR family transcriptional regulator [Christensenellaceae bacterium OttesenSCG-928-M15]|nr:GntR family transcriptional regulator [Christensenellaceae bacterium OttesenSCG-928-M15]